MTIKKVRSKVTGKIVKNHYVLYDGEKLVMNNLSFINGEWNHYTVSYANVNINNIDDAIIETETVYNMELYKPLCTELNKERLDRLRYIKEILLQIRHITPNDVTEICTE